MKILRPILYICVVVTSEIFAFTSDRIIAGRNCSSQEYPYYASMVEGTTHFCGGSFITPRWVLTAAHCCKKMRKLWSFTIVAGQSRLMHDEQEYSFVEAAYAHEQHKDLPLSSDICLVKLNKPVTPSASIKISKLATTADYERLIKNGICHNSLIMGFGSTEPFNSTKVPPKLQTIDHKKKDEKKDDHIKCANLSVLPRSECQEKLPRYVSDNTTFCMKHPVLENIDSCKGDSGGPVYCENLQIGIVAAGLGCGQKQYPGFYIRVDQFTDFIERHLHLDEGKSSAVQLKGTLMIFAIIINIVAIFNTIILNTYF